MRLRHRTVVVLAAAALVLGACGDDDKDSSSSETSSTTTSQSSSRAATTTSAAESGDEALAAYAEDICGIQEGLQQDLAAADATLEDPATGPEQAAATLSDLATSFDETATDIADLGDPPNGEGEGLTATASELFATAAEGLESVAGQVADGTLTDSESTGAALQPILQAWSEGLTALSTDYPTPGLDAAQQAIPGCTDS